MVNGIDSFRDKFRLYPDCYTVIGGAACDILMSEADIDFRLTKDIDMILVLEDKEHEFVNTFWEYIKEGGYKCGWKNNDDVHFYRFTEPKPGYPVMIELFSRKPDYELKVDQGIIPIHIDDDTSSLSAILLSDDFYEFMMDGRRVVEDICVLGAEYLIPFKMYAWLDLKRRKANGEHVNDRDYKKHRNDVFRLLQIVDNDARIETNGMVRDSVDRFLDEIKNEPVRVDQIGLNIPFEEALELLRSIYNSL